MIEVFKTNVKDPRHAHLLIHQIQKSFRHYQAHFDLDDCDNILRIKSMDDNIPPARVISLLHDHGFQAEVLPD